MNKFPQNEWVEIDGQRVPFTKPQHYIGENNEEVRLTGEKDPLPVKNREGKSVAFTKFDSGDIEPGKNKQLNFEISGGNVSRIAISTMNRPASTDVEVTFSWYLADYITMYAVTNSIPNLTADSRYGLASNQIDVSNDKFTIVIRNKDDKTIRLDIKIAVFGNDIKGNEVNLR